MQVLKESVRNAIVEGAIAEFFHIGYSLVCEGMLSLDVKDEWPGSPWMNIFQKNTSFFGSEHISNVIKDSDINLNI